MINSECGRPKQNSKAEEGGKSIKSTTTGDLFMDSDPIDPNSQTASPGDETTLGPDTPSEGGRTAAKIGRYRIIRLLGEGGMGAVYQAEQDQPRRLVALKVIKSSLSSPSLLRRFEQESEALARLHHPGIAQVYDAGTADSGTGVQPFFAMEFIAGGQPVTEYAEAHHLNTQQRLELMVEICDAVQHAHQRGIIHRDLKPANILVDEHGHPKILDFGVARVTDSDTQATRQTDLGQLIGTLSYMSPEQALADPLELDTRSDVYALGVILYELLAGKLPYTLSKKLHEAVSTIREQDPAALSSVSRLYRGDLETVVAKAMEKDKARRYGSAAALAADLRRYLKDEPILARPASASYQLYKFARRNRALVAGVAAVFVVLVAGVVVSTWEAVRARAAERRANSETAATKAINDFLANDLLAQANPERQSDPGIKPDPDLKVRTVLDRAAARIVGRFDEPEIEASIRDTIGRTYTSLGVYQEAQKQLESALELRRRALGPGNPKTLKTALNLGVAVDFFGKYSEAETIDKKTLEALRRVLGPENPDTLDCMKNLSRVYSDQGKYAQAEALYKQTLEIQRRVLGPEHRQTLGSMVNLGWVYIYQGKFAEAEALFKQSLEIQRRVLGPEHPDTLGSMVSLGWVYNNEKHYAQAEEIQKQALEIHRQVLGPEHHNTLGIMNNLARTYDDEGKYAQAEALLSQTLALERRVLGPEHPTTLISMGNLSRVYSEQGKYAQAGALYKQTLEIRRRVLGPEHPETVAAIENLGFVYFQEGKFTQAVPLLDQALEIHLRVDGPEHPNTLYTHQMLSYALSHVGRYGEAEKMFREAIQKASKEKQPDGWYDFACGAAIAGRREEALQYLSEAVDRGFQGGDRMANDSDLKSLHGDPRFEALVGSARQAVAKAH
jgi:tetratricopeptide (TPR) repeat protein